MAGVLRLLRQFCYQSSTDALSAVAAVGVAPAAILGDIFHTARSSQRRHCKIYLAVIIEKVSVRSLLKTGIFPLRAGDFREILAKVAHLRRQYRRAIMQKYPYFKGFL